ncbi:unnamed protein product, partial [Eretmochelys imbricata]
GSTASPRYPSWQVGDTPGLLAVGSTALPRYPSWQVAAGRGQSSGHFAEDMERKDPKKRRRVLHSSEPPVRIVSSNEDATHTYLASERVVLACELSRADGPVQWYKDGVEVEEGDCLLLEREGPHRRLVIPSARPQDTGEFVCDAGGDSVFYNITVTG